MVFFVSFQGSKQPIMEEELKKNITHNSTESSGQSVQKNITGLLETTKIFLIELFDFREDTDHEATIEAIKVDIPFKGATAWILIFAVFFGFYRLECKLYRCCDWCHVNISFNGTYFRNWNVFRFKRHRYL